MPVDTSISREILPRRPKNLRHEVGIVGSQPQNLFTKFFPAIKIISYQFLRQPWDERLVAHRLDAFVNGSNKRSDYIS